ncbi:MAG: hypothetical protein V4864_05620 [Pseudomonadota bacterium]
MKLVSLALNCIAVVFVVGCGPSQEELAIKAGNECRIRTLSKLNAVIPNVLASDSPERWGKVAHDIGAAALALDTKGCRQGTVNGIQRVLEGTEKLKSAARDSGGVGDTVPSLFGQKKPSNQAMSDAYSLILQGVKIVENS